MKIVQHIADDTLEQYAMQTLPDTEAGPLFVLLTNANHFGLAEDAVFVSH